MGLVHGHILLLLQRQRLGARVSDDEEMTSEEKKLDDNVKIIDMFIFSEANMLY